MLPATANQLQASLNLSEGPIIRATLFHLGNNQSNRLLIIIHHLAVDGVSWRILLEDLIVAYQQLSRGETIQLPAKTTSFQDWAIRLTEYAQSQTALAELDYWLTQVDAQISPLPVDYPAEIRENQIAYIDKVSVSLSAEQTIALLKEVSKAYNTQINDVLITALGQSFAQWTGQTSLLIDLEGHGREELFESVNLSRTVGWFTSVFPILLKLEQAELPGKSLKSIKEQLRRIPQRGIGYGIIRYLSESETIRHQLQQLPQAQVIFNYLGQFDQMLSAFPILGLAKESSGSTVSLKASRSHLLEINVWVADGKLQLSWVYSTKFHKKATIERLANGFIQALTSLISHCLSLETYGYTPTDFPDADLTQAELDELVESLTHKIQIESIYPLSSMQEGMLFHTLYAPNSEVYFEQFVFNLNGKLNISAFEQAWQRVVELHPVLRTFFVWKNRQHPLQVACKSVNLPWHIYDWRFLQEAEQKERLETFLQTERENGFQLDKLPLICCTLIQLAEDRYQFVWSHHHLLIDGWSLPIVLKQVWTFYQAFNQGENLYLNAPPPYQNYIAWLQKQDLKVAENFWRKTLEGFTEPTPLVVDKLVENLSERKYIYGEQNIKLSALLTEAMRSLAQQHHLTLNTLVQGAWALLLSRYSGESEVVFGATVSGRPPALLGVESMVGLFINTLPVRVKISPETELLFWLKQLQKQQIEREQYSYSPLVDIQGWSNVPRNLALFNSIVVFENYPVGSSLLEEKDSIEISNVRGFERTNYPLTVSVVPEQELSIEISYDTDRFDDHTVSRMLGHFQTLLEGMAANPKRTISTLPLLTPNERHTLLIEWNHTSQDYPCDRCIHQLFEEQVERTPDEIAVVYNEEYLTYQQLNQKANQLAHYLQKKGIQPQQLIGICEERSLDLIVSVLATLKAGCAYVPLAPDYPPQRLAYTLEDAAVSLILTRDSFSSIFFESKATIVALDIDESLISQQGKNNPAIAIVPDDLAYVIYTSGSTGKPKGVAIAHTNVVSIYSAWQAAYQLNIKAHNILQMASFSFDVFVGDLVRALCSGGKLVLCPPNSLIAPEKLYKLIEKERISLADFVPSVLRGLSVYLEKTYQKLDSLEIVIVGSEPCYIKDYQQFKQFCQPQSRLINSYGVTEATIDSCYFETTEIDLFKTQLVPIGRPYQNTQVYLLDRHLQPVPIGVPGELHIAGDGLAKGYLNLPDLTQEKFIPHPFCNHPHSRLYKTGDLARYLSDGTIEFLGRIDHQIKLRGFRIELPEIESVLNLHPEVQQAVVLLAENSQNDKVLAAYLIAKNQSINASDLRLFLQQRLPGYMIPSAFVVLESFPLTPNGKVDRKAFPKLNREPSNEREFIPPRDYIEQQMAQIWSEVLSLHPIGIRDNFFDLGGYSLLAIRLMAQIQQKFQQTLPLAILFEAPTIEQLSNRLRSAKLSISWPSLVPIQPHGHKPPLFFVPGAGGNLIYLYQLAKALGCERPFYGLQAQGLDGESKILTTMEEIAAHYVKEMMAVQPEGAYFIAGHSFGSLVAFEIAQQLLRQGRKIAFLAILDSYAPLAELEFQPLIAQMSDLQWLTKMVGLVEELVAQPLEIDWKAMESLSWDEQLNHIKDQLVEVNFLPPDIGIKQLRRLVEVFKTQYLINYVPQNVEPTSITLFKTQEFTGQEFLPCDVLQDPTLGWQRLASSIEVYTVPGNHITMLDQPHVEILAQKLIPYLSRE